MGENLIKNLSKFVFVDKTVKMKFKRNYGFFLAEVCKYNLKTCNERIQKSKFSSQQQQT